MQTHDLNLVVMDLVFMTLESRLPLRVWATGFRGQWFVRFVLLIGEGGRQNNRKHVPMRSGLDFDNKPPWPGSLPLPMTGVSCSFKLLQAVKTKRGGWCSSSRVYGCK